MYFYVHIYGHMYNVYIILHIYCMHAYCIILYYTTFIAI